MKRKPDKYAEFADHPRFGRRPNITGLNPDPMRNDVQLHWNTTTHHEVVKRYEAVVGKKWPHGGDMSNYSRGDRIPNTAVVADLSRQTHAVVPVTHYFDLERQCWDCKRRFIFFALEQKHWFEELGFTLESDCIRCAACRKLQQGLAQKRELYETLFHVEDRTVEQTLQMVDCCLALIEADVFSPRQLERVRMLLNRIPADVDSKTKSHCDKFRERVRCIEEKAD